MTLNGFMARGFWWAEQDRIGRGRAQTSVDIFMFVQTNVVLELGRFLFPFGRGWQPVEQAAESPFGQKMMLRRLV
jgi:hypothetical protein